MITPLAGRRWGPVLLTCAAWLFMGAFAAAAQEPAKIWTVPEVGALPDNEQGRLVRRGRDLITATYAHIGPEVPGSITINSSYFIHFASMKQFRMITWFVR